MIRRIVSISITTITFVSLFFSVSVNANSLTTSGAKADTDNHAELQQWGDFADNGDAIAQYRLGNFYLGDRGKHQDFKLAFKYFTLAAKQGHGMSQYHLGWMYRYGHGVPKDENLAIHWYGLAATHAIPWAQKELGWIYKKGLGVDKNLETARLWFGEARKGFIRAAKIGNSDAQIELSTMELDSKGEIDRVRGRMWLKVAEAQGNGKATLLLGLIDGLTSKSAHLTPEQMQQVDTLVSDCRAKNFLDC